MPPVLLFLFTMFISEPLAIARSEVDEESGLIIRTNPDPLAELVRRPVDADHKIPARG